MKGLFTYLVALLVFTSGYFCKQLTPAYSKCDQFQYVCSVRTTSEIGPFTYRMTNGGSVQCYMYDIRASTNDWINWRWWNANIYSYHTDITGKLKCYVNNRWYNNYARMDIEIEGGDNLTRSGISQRFSEIMNMVKGRTLSHYKNHFKDNDDDIIISILD